MHLSMLSPREGTLGICGAFDFSEEPLVKFLRVRKAKEVKCPTNPLGPPCPCSGLILIDTLFPDFVLHCKSRWWHLNSLISLKRVQVQVTGQVTITIIITISITITIIIIWQGKSEHSDWFFLGRILICTKRTVSMEMAQTVYFFWFSKACKFICSF